MKKTLLFLILLSNLVANAQEISVEKSIFTIHTGFLGVWFNNESKLSNNVSLKTEIGLEKDFSVGDHYDGAGFILQPVLTLEPRHYYNFEKRKNSNKKTAKNSGNFVALKTSYHPDWFVINLDENTTKTADLAIVPTWGLKRQIGNHFNYEAALGLGYRIIYIKANSINGNVQNVDGAYNQHQYIPYFNVRAGYTF